MLHALAGLPRWMERLAKVLRKEMQVVQVACPTLFEDIDASEARIRAVLSAMAEDGIRSVTLIGHSYGGLLARVLLRQPLPVNVHRIVMLGTPNQGSLLAAILTHFALYRWIFGAAGQDVMARSACGLPVPTMPVLSIAGGVGRYGLNPLLPGDDDGVVTVAETRLAGSNTRCVTVRGLHRFLPRNKSAIAAIFTFLEETA